MIKPVLIILNSYTVRIHTHSQFANQSHIYKKIEINFEQNNYPKM